MTISNLLQQIKKRRIGLGLKQRDMELRAGMSRQQYQRLESKGNPRLDTLELLATALNSELLLVPREKINRVRSITEDSGSSGRDKQAGVDAIEEPESSIDDPWQDLL